MVFGNDILVGLALLIFMKFRIFGYRAVDYNTFIIYGYRRTSLAFFYIFLNLIPIENGLLYWKNYRISLKKILTMP